MKVFTIFLKNNECHVGTVISEDDSVNADEALEAFIDADLIDGKGLIAVEDKEPVILS